MADFKYFISSLKFFNSNISTRDFFIFYLTKLLGLAYLFVNGK